MDKGTGGFLQPKKVLDELDIQENIKVADFGSGHGYFSIPLAKAVGQNGRVYALDVMKEALEVVNSQAKLEGITNIEAVHCNLENPNGSKLPDQSLDLVLLAKILFQSEKKSAIIQEAKRVLKTEGKLVLIDWLPGTTLAPKKGWLMSQAEAKKLVEEEGLKMEREFSVDTQHFGMIFKKT